MATSVRTRLAQPVAVSPLYTTKQIDATELMPAFYAEHRLAGI
jgi:hypothetical protein